MAAGSSNSAAGVLTQLSETSNSSSDEQDNEVDDTISIISSTSGSGSTSTGSTSKPTTEAHIGQLLQRWLLLFSLHQVLLKGYSQF